MTNYAAWELDLLKLVNQDGHAVAVDPHRCHYGDGWQPRCLEDDRCDYVGPIVSRVRAYAIAEEHRRKSAGTWGRAR